MNAEAAKENRANHRITLEAREGVQVRGVTDVISFDEETVVLHTVCGGLTVEGESLHVQVLDMEAGIVTMDGRIDSVTYFEQETKDTREKTGFFGKIFR